MLPPVVICALGQLSVAFPLVWQQLLACPLSTESLEALPVLGQGPEHPWKSTGHRPACQRALSLWPRIVRQGQEDLVCGSRDGRVWVASNLVSRKERVCM